MTRRRLCRALDCPRHVDRAVLFCNVHWTQLPPKLQAPIITNIEAPGNAGIDAQRAVIGGVRSATAYLAKREGKGSAHAEALRAGSFAAGQGGDGGSGSGTAGGAIAGGGGGGIKDGGSGRLVSKS